MKALKIILISVVALIAIVLLVGFIFLKTVDLNKFKPQIVSQVKSATSRDLTLGRIDLGLSRGLSLEVSDVSLSDDPRFSQSPFVTVKKVVLGLELMPLITQRKVEITHVVIDSPKIALIRNKEGVINAVTIGAQKPAQTPQETQPAGSQTQDRPAEAQAPALPPLLVKDLSVRNAEVSFVDETMTPKLDVSLKRLDIAVADLSLDKPFSYDLKASLFSGEQNLALKGLARVELAKLGVVITDLAFSSDLSQLSLNDLTGSLPMLSAAQLKVLKGRFALNVSEATANVLGLQSLKARVTLNNGVVTTGLVPLPVENIGITLDADARDLKLASATANIAEGTINASGSVNNYLGKPIIDLKGDIKGVETGKISTAYKLPVKVTGRTSMDFTANLAGKTPEEMTSSLRAVLNGKIEGGTIEGMNLVQQTLNSIPGIPVWDMVKEDLPPETREDIEKGVSVIERCDFNAQMLGMTATIEKAELVTRDFMVSAKGTANVPDSLDVKADLVLQKKVSDVLVKKVSDLGGLADAEGRVYIPVLIKGPMTSPQVAPDSQYLTQKLLINRGTRELEKVIEKNPEVQGILNSIFGVPSNQQPQQAPGEGDSQGEPRSAVDSSDQKTASAQQAVGAVLNALFK